MYVFLRFFTFFFQNPKNMTFYVFLSCCTHFPEQWHIVINVKKIVQRRGSEGAVQHADETDDRTEDAVGNVEECYRNGTADDEVEI